VSVFVIFPESRYPADDGDSEIVTGGKDAMETGFALSEIDTTTPHPARMYDALLGGKDNYAADRQAVRQVLKAAPEIHDSARANRAFLQRAVRFLVGEAGIRQIIDVGTGIPAAGNVHEVAAQVAPGTRVAYVDNDPIVHVHANALLTGSGTSIILADLREPEAILAHPKVRALIDFTQPVALLLVAILHFITNQESPARILAALHDALPPGSYLALSHATGDFRPAAAQQAAAVYDHATSPVTLRTRGQVAAFLDGWDLTEPGLVQVPLWRPDGKPPRPRELDRAWVTAGSPA
jgi:S-adenosyl methyltransferase